MSADTLTAVLDVKDATRDVRLAIETITPLLNAAAERSSLPHERDVEEIVRTGLEITKFPLPITPRLLIDELIALYPHKTQMDSLEGCLYQVQVDEMPVDARTASEFVARLVNSLRGKSPETLRSLFSCLSKQKPASNILRFACEYLEPRGVSS